MVTIYHWFLRQFGKLVLLPDYFRVLAKEWLNILFGETLVGIGFLLWWSLAGPSNANLIAVFVAAMFVAGFYAWRADHTRLLPKLEVKDFTGRQPTRSVKMDEKMDGANISNSCLGAQRKETWKSAVVSSRLSKCLTGSPMSGSQPKKK